MGKVRPVLSFAIRCSFSGSDAYGGEIKGRFFSLKKIYICENVLSFWRVSLVARCFFTRFAYLKWQVLTIIVYILSCFNVFTLFFLQTFLMLVTKAPTQNLQL